MEQREADRPEATAEAEGDLGHPDSTAIGSSSPGTALFNLAIHSKLRGRDLVGLHVRDVFQGSHVAPRAIVMQKKTQRPVQFEITEQTRDAVDAWITAAQLKARAAPLSEPRYGIATSVDPAIFPDRRVLGGVDWA